MDDILVFRGSAVKALGNGKVGGFLVAYGDQDHVDLEGDYFDLSTNLGLETGDRVPVFYNHGLDPVLKKRQLSRGVVKEMGAGLWLETQLQLRDEYEKAIYQLAAAGKLGWSSGSVSHLVEKRRVGRANHIVTWPLAEGSLTVSPAQPMLTQVQSLKSWSMAAPPSLMPVVFRPGQAMSDRLQDIAQRYLPGTLELRINGHFTEAGQAGEIERKAGKYVIRLDRDLIGERKADLGRVLFHEIAHGVKSHLTRAVKQGDEAEAERWAQAELRSFEEVNGPFLDRVWNGSFEATMERANKLFG